MDVIDVLGCAERPHGPRELTNDFRLSREFSLVGLARPRRLDSLGAKIMIAIIKVITVLQSSGNARPHRALFGDMVQELHSSDFVSDIFMEPPGIVGNAVNGCIAAPTVFLVSGFPSVSTCVGPLSVNSELVGTVFPQTVPPPNSLHNSSPEVDVGRHGIQDIVDPILHLPDSEHVVVVINK